MSTASAWSRWASWSAEASQACRHTDPLCRGRARRMPSSKRRSRSRRRSALKARREAGRAIAAGERLGTQPKLAVRVNPPFSIDGGRVTMGAPAEPVRSGCGARARAWRRAYRSRRRLARAARVRRLAVPRSERSDPGPQGDCRGRRRDCATIGRRCPSSTAAAALTSPASPGRQPLDIDKVAAALNETLCNAPELLATTRFSIELGRWLVGEAGVYLTRVFDRTESGGRDVPDDRRRRASSDRRDRRPRRAAAAAITRSRSPTASAARPRRK